MKVLVNDPISEKGIEKLRNAGLEVEIKHYSDEELRERIKEFDAIIVRSATKVTREIIEAGKGKLKVIGRAGVGVDNIDVKAATEARILVVNAPSAPTRSVAELTLGFAIALARDLVEANNELKSGKWTKKKHKGFELKGKTWGVIGLGRIGREVARIALALGMRVIAYDPIVPGMEGVEMKKSLDDVLREADIVSIHVPLLPQTYHLIGERELNLMKKNAILINVARGGIVDEEALAKAIKEGKIAGAALDVFEEEPPKEDSPVLKCDRIYVTPHIGANTKEAQDAAGEIIAEQVIKALKGERPDFVVNRELLKRWDRYAPSTKRDLEKARILYNWRALWSQDLLLDQGVLNFQEIVL